MKSSVVSGLALWQWRLNARKSAVEEGIPVHEVDWLLQEVAKLDSLSLRLESFKERSQITLPYPLSRLSQLWQERLNNRVPIQYLAGVTPWRNFALKVSPAVLIPRPETEYIIDIAIAAIKNSPTPELEWGEWADLGTGSGAIAIGLAEAFPSATIHAVDCAPDALAIAQLNAENLGLQGRIKFYQGSWLSPLLAIKGKLSGIVSNPPYIPSSEIPQLQPEVANHEPQIALDGGIDGLDAIRYLITTAPDYLLPGGILLVEMMAGQADTVLKLFHEQGSYCQIQICRDLAGIERFALAFRNSE
ncbi:MAG TPA: peptide chain release factor N(5)-glutamine methyltransferase [Cyanobacteria bacterium UBA11149]|nr:peptide chain release factor N(5)-glutamine methyltransferase [Cyanobacteria bacterium UBA11367]HBE56538.1 peptide chain release factor N(5)-glutamine methyltransferase [Cyanobacteria bacterium UBA11366]HBK62368.1 peptide chain release factor N(5)-glutamine methyltransferase [Cyanobacteria bacterium UBA11166]HBR75673.1 peptide chain release factor N(5)-glutamine methyltransferase [Cyanobacteria bacterium UBA11159]HBS68603.1 peptide chain release factor N(5)-glutamine methyltransferase [Cyano